MAEDGLRDFAVGVRWHHCINREATRYGVASLFVPEWAISQQCR